MGPAAKKNDGNPPKKTEKPLVFDANHAILYQNHNPQIPTKE